MDRIQAVLVVMVDLVVEEELVPLVVMVRVTLVQDKLNKDILEGLVLVHMREAAAVELDNQVKMLFLVLMEMVVWVKYCLMMLQLYIEKVFQMLMELLVLMLEDGLQVAEEVVQEVAPLVE